MEFSPQNTGAEPFVCCLSKDVSVHIASVANFRRFVVRTYGPCRNTVFGAVQLLRNAPGGGGGQPSVTLCDRGRGVGRALRITPKIFLYV